MDITCNKCHRIYKNISEENIGKKSKCIKCGNIFIIEKIKSLNKVLLFKNIIFNNTKIIFILSFILILLIVFISHLLNKNNINYESYIPNENSEYVIVTLHGYGANGKDIMGAGVKILSFLQKQLQNNVMIYSPDAPYKTSVLSRYSRTNRKVDFEESTNKLVEYIDSIHDNSNIAYKNIFILGFSEGGAMALHVSDKLKGEVGGIIVVGSGLFESDHNHNFTKKQSLYILAGDEDQFAPVNRLNSTQEYLNSFGWNVKKEIFPGLGHTISLEQLEKIAKYIEDIILSFD